MKKSVALFISVVLASAVTVAPAHAGATSPTPGGDSRPCYIGITGYTVDGRIVGPMNTRHNFANYYTSNGTCGSPVWVYGTVVAANDLTQAVRICQSILGFAGPSRLLNWIDVNAPAMWIC